MPSAFRDNPFASCRSRSMATESAPPETAAQTRSPGRRCSRSRVGVGVCGICSWISAGSGSASLCGCLGGHALIKSGKLADSRLRLRPVGLLVVIVPAGRLANWVGLHDDAVAPGEYV